MMLYMHRVQRAADVALKLEPTVVHDDVQSIMYVRLSDVEQLNRILIVRHEWLGADERPRWTHLRRVPPVCCKLEHNA